MAAVMLKPPRPTLDISMVLDCVYLAQFDLLHKSCSDLSSMPWAQQAERQTATNFFKLQHSWEEVDHLNIEIHRLWRWMDNDEAFLLKHSRRLQAAAKPALAWLVH